MKSTYLYAKYPGCMFHWENRATIYLKLKNINIIVLIFWHKNIGCVIVMTALEKQFETIVWAGHLFGNCSKEFVQKSINQLWHSIYVCNAEKNVI